MGVITTPIRVLGPREGSKKAREAEALNVTSSSKDWGRSFSPMVLGPVRLPSGDRSLTVENAWQFSKLAPGTLGTNGQPTEEWWAWARGGWARAKGERYPRGRDAKTVGSWWDGQVLGYLEARRHIYAPLYAQAVKDSANWGRLQEWAAAQEARGITPTFWDFDGRERGTQSLIDVATDPSKALGHGFVLAAMLHYTTAEEWSRFLTGWDQRLVAMARVRKTSTGSL